ncbi:uncharacterized protein [Miscanthus floridulus]|uniref:uncharacterized protein n=1 Tax=Miscanthus floridulus TaxID=154761 RepID=UPI0034583830
MGRGCGGRRVARGRAVTRWLAGVGASAGAAHGEGRVVRGAGGGPVLAGGGAGMVGIGGAGKGGSAWRRRRPGGWRARARRTGRGGGGGNAVRGRAGVGGRRRGDGRERWHGVALAGSGARAGLFRILYNLRDIRGIALHIDEGFVTRL